MNINDLLAQLKEAAANSIRNLWSEDRSQSQPYILDSELEWMPTQRINLISHTRLRVIDVCDVPKSNIIIVFTAVSDPKGIYRYSGGRTDAPILIINMTTLRILKHIYLPIFSYRAHYLKSTNEFLLVSNSNSLSIRFTQNIIKKRAKMYSMYRISARGKIQEKISADESSFHQFVIIEKTMELVSADRSRGLVLWSIRRLSSTPTEKRFETYFYEELVYSEASHAIIGYVPRKQLIQVIDWSTKNIAHVLDTEEYDFTFDDKSVLNFRCVLLCSPASSRVYIASEQEDHIEVDLNNTHLILAKSKGLQEWHEDFNTEAKFLMPQKDLYLSLCHSGRLYVKELESARVLHEVKCNTISPDRVYSLLGGRLLACFSGTEYQRFTFLSPKKR